MTEQSKKQVQKALPFKNKVGFTGLPNEIFDIYVSHPKFTGNCVLVYMYLLHKYNGEQGYAWPTQDQIADATFLSRRQVIRIISVLESVGLIRTLYNSDYGNNAYVPLKPISSLDVFEATFPEAIENRAKFEAARVTDKEPRKKRQTDFRETLAQLRAQSQK